MSEHTPGPWRVERAEGGFYRNRRTVRSDEHSRPGVTDGRDCIAEVHRETEARAAADAELIASAPTLHRENELLRAALADALRTWTFSEGQQHTHTWHDREDWRERHRAAIEAAERAT